VGVFFSPSFFDSSQQQKRLSVADLTLSLFGCYKFFTYILHIVHLHGSIIPFYVRIYCSDNRHVV
jgi:hypothetical protein